MQNFQEWLGERHPEILEEKKKNWIKGAVKHPGRCTPLENNPDCPKGSPQYNLAKRFKHGDIHADNEAKND